MLLTSPASAPTLLQRALPQGGAEVVTVEGAATIPGDDGGDPSRRVLEAFALEELRAGRITEPELGQMLGIGRLQLDGFLKTHDIFQDYAMEDFEAERQALKEIGF